MKLTVLNILILSLSLSLISCGSKKKKNTSTLNQDNNQQIRNLEQNTEPQEELKGPQTYQSEDLYYSLITSKLDAKRVDAGENILIECFGNEYIGMVHGCRLGFTQRDIEIGQYFLDTQESRELLEIVENSKIRVNLIKGHIMNMSCKDKCEISELQKQNTAQ